jgi:hypothetical protein
MSQHHFDASSDPPDPQDRSPGRSKRPFLGVQFQCCGVYARIYLNANETAFAGYCPRCGRRIEFQVAPTGSCARFFTVY